MVNTIENIKKPHKYNVGDEITVKIATVREGGTEYSFVGAENTFFSEKAIEEMEVKKIKPGDIIYQVAECEEESIVWFDAVKVVDVATKEIKIFNDWFDIEGSAIFTMEEIAERYAEGLARSFNYKIVKGGLFDQEVADGRE